MRFNELEPVLLTRDIPEKNLTKGMGGTILDVFTMPEPGYMVEFCDDYGVTVSVIPLTDSDLEPYKLK